MDTTFVDKQTIIEASWLNDINALRYGAGDPLKGSALLQFIARGTGALTLAAQAKMRQWVNAADYHDGVSADWTSAIQKAVTDLEANGGGILVLPPGYLFTSSAITITKGIWVLGSGTGAGAGAGNSGGTLIRSLAAAGDIFTVSCDESVIFENFMIDAPGVTKAVGTAGIRLQGAGGAGTTGRRCRLFNVHIHNMYDAVVLNASMDCKIAYCHIQDFLKRGIYAQMTGADDSGHTVVEGCTIWDFNVGTSDACVYWTKGGDWHLTNNKFLGGNVNVWIASNNASPTGTFQLANNSFEEPRTNCLRVEQSAINASFGNLQVNGNQFSMVGSATPQSTIAIVGGTPAGTWISNITITDNVVNDTVDVAYPIISVQDGEHIFVGGNVLDANGSTLRLGIDVGGNATQARIGANQIFLGTVGNEYTASSVLFKEQAGVLQVGTGPATVAAGATVYLTTSGATAVQAQGLMYLSTSGFLCRLRASAETGPGVGQTYTYTVQVNGIDTALQVVAAGANSGGFDITHVVTVLSPDVITTAARVSVKLVTSAGAAVGSHNVTVEIVENDED